MPRIRTVKPEHWDDKELPTISLQAHLLWIGIWNFSDDQGIIENDAVLIRSKIFPRRTDIRIEQVKEWIGQLIKARFMVPFEHEGESYLISRTFGAHQKIDKPNPSKIPSDVIRGLFAERSEKGRPCRVEESNSSGEESKEEARSRPEPSPLESAFDDFLSMRRKIKKPATKKAIQLLESKLKKLAGDDEQLKIAIINQSTLNCWQDLYPLKEEKEKSSAKKESRGAVAAINAFSNTPMYD